jgi:hypothetical protein
LNILSCNAAYLLLIAWSYRFKSYNIHTAFNISATCFAPDVVQKNFKMYNSVLLCYWLRYKTADTNITRVNHVCLRKEVGIYSEHFNVPFSVGFAVQLSHFTRNLVLRVREH